MDGVACASWRALLHGCVPDFALEDKLGELGILDDGLRRFDFLSAGLLPTWLAVGHVAISVDYTYSSIGKFLPLPYLLNNLLQH